MGPLLFDWLLHPAVLYLGGLLVSVPIVLHLMMRQKPKPLVFPALRLVQERRESNRRRLRLRHLLLLLLRCLAILLLAAALARPVIAQGAGGAWVVVGLLAAGFLVLATLAAAARLSQRPRPLWIALASLAAASLLACLLYGAATLSSRGGTAGAQEEPVAAALVIDSSPRMTYREGDASLLEEAVKMARQVLDDLPDDSDVAVLDSRLSGAWFRGGPAAAERDLGRLESTTTPAPLTQVLQSAVELVKTSSRPHKEVYVFSDMTAASWRSENRSLARILQREPALQVYLIDVGVAQPKNAWLSDVALSSQSLSKSGTLTLRVDVGAVGQSASRTVELHLEEPDPTRPVIENGKVQLPVQKRRGRRSVKVKPGAAQAVSFEIGGLKTLGAYQGQIRLTGADALPVDDVRYFAFQTAPARKVLIAAGAAASARYLTEALAPYQLRETGRAAFDCTVVPQTALASEKLEDFSAVCLLDPSPLTPDQWRRLTAYVRDGGAVAVCLGAHALGKNALPHPSFIDAAAREFLGCRLQVQKRAGDGAWFLAPRTLEHAVLADFRAIATTVPWRGFPIFKYWSVSGLAAGAAVAVPFDNGDPALLENSLGDGVVLVMTTPISDSSRTWNELPTGENAWPYFVLANAMFHYLVDRQGARMNYSAGETAVLNNRAGVDPERYQLFPPQGDVREVIAHEGRVTVRFTEYLGAYRLKGHADGPVIRGFAVNLPALETSLERADGEHLDRVLGKERYAFLKDVKELKRTVGKARQGPELFPVLILLAALILSAEGLLANFFYGAGKPSPAAQNSG